ncbi:MAG: protein kinase [Pirellulaceae bacterium]|nr:protein kinase [Pirellulaceae bacterium]
MGITAEQFIENLSTSGLLTTDDVASLRTSLQKEDQPSDVNSIVQRLMREGKLTKYQAKAVYVGKTRGLVLGQYVVLDRIGKGGMGQVLKARHRTMDRIVALKVLSVSAMDSPDAVSRFHREARAAAKLSHPNIVTAYDASEHEGIHYLVMEFVEGKDLAEVVKEHGALPVDKAIDSILQAAKGLEYAHAQGVVHRDIKPANLLLDKEGTIKILDMGLALMSRSIKTANDETTDQLTSGGLILGTCDYIAPEQADDSHAADHRSDIYSLGCTLYRLLTGELPYKADSVVRVLLAHRQAPIPSLCEVRSSVPPQLDAVFQKMVAKEPEDRYQAATEVITDLQACLEPAQTTSEPTPQAPSTDSQLQSFLQLLPRDGVAGSRQKTKKTQDSSEETVASQTERQTAGDNQEKEKEVAGRARKWVIPSVVAGAAVVLLLIATLVVVLILGGNEEPRAGNASGAAQADGDANNGGQGPSHLILAWDEAERGDATLEVDGRKLDIQEHSVPANGGQIKVPLEAGDHELWIARRGFEPIQQKISVVKGRDVVIEPVWKELNATRALD